MHAQVCEKFKVIAPDVDHAGPMWVIFAAGFLTGALMHACMHAYVRACKHTCTTRALKILASCCGCLRTYMHAQIHAYILTSNCALDFDATTALAMNVSPSYRHTAPGRVALGAALATFSRRYSRPCIVPAGICITVCMCVCASCLIRVCSPPRLPGCRRQVLCVCMFV